MRDMNYSNAVYPSAAEIEGASEDNQPFPLPPLLLLFIQSIVRSSRLKQVAIAQAVIQAARPQKCIMPLLFGLSVQLDHEFGSEFLLQQLSRLGFSLSYDEVTRFKSSVMQLSNPVSDKLGEVSSSGVSDATDFSHNFTQSVADNVDHNVRTLDGNNTFHGMGIISATTTMKVGAGCITSGHIQRLARTKMSDICKEVALSIVPYHKKPGVGLETIKMNNIRSLKSPTLLPNASGDQHQHTVAHVWSKTSSRLETELEWIHADSLFRNTCATLYCEHSADP